MLQLADGVDIGTRFYQERAVIDAAWTLQYPTEPYFKSSVFSNLDIQEDEIDLGEGIILQVYTAPKVWVNKVRFGRAAGEIALSDPPCLRRTISDP